MKLITEATFSEDIHYIVEKTSDELKKNVFIEGIFMQAEKENRNRRIYESKILKPAVDRYVREEVLTKRAVGELNHPDGPSINLDKVSHRITDLRFEGNNVIGKALILDTPMGQIVKGLVDGGVKLGVSSRGMGSLVTRDGRTFVGEDYVLKTVDIVQDPSAPEAFVDGIMEGVDWIYENGLFKGQQIERYETEIKKTPSAKLDEAKLRVWYDFLSGLNPKM